MTTSILETRTLLANADRAFDADKFHEGCRLMWEATHTALAAVAVSNNWPAETEDDITEAVYRLDGIVFGNNGALESYDTLSHFGAYGVAKDFKDRAEKVWWVEDYPEFHWDDAELRSARKSVKSFIGKLEELA